MELCFILALVSLRLKTPL